MSAHDKAMDKASKHTHKKGSDGKCTICNMVMEKDPEAGEKGKMPKKEFGAKNNDSEED